MTPARIILNIETEYAAIRAAQEKPLSADELALLVTALRAHRSWSHRRDPKTHELPAPAIDLLVSTQIGLAVGLGTASKQWHLTDDTVQGAYLGVVEAILKFDLSKGVRLYSYARLYALRNVRQTNAELQGAAVIPKVTMHVHRERMKEAAMSVAHAYDEASELDTDADAAIDSIMAEEPPAIARMVAALFPRHFGTVGEDGEPSIDPVDVRPTPEEAVIEALDFEKQLNALNAALASGLLTERELDVLDYRYFGGFNETDTASYLGIARSGVQKAEARAMRKLRETLGADERSLALVPAV